MALIDDIYQRMAPSHVIYVRLMKNRLEIKHLKTGKTLERTAETPFSNERLLITDPSKAESFAKELIAELLELNKKLLDRALTVVLQPVEPAFSEITPVEKMIYQDFAMYIGAKKYYLVEHRRRLTDEEVKEIFERFGK